MVKYTMGQLYEHMENELFTVISFCSRFKFCKAVFFVCIIKFYDSYSLWGETHIGP